MTDDRPTSLVPRIERELRRRLEELDRERAVVAAALAALDPSPAPPPTPRRRPRVTAAAVLDAVRADPGVRASMLALALDVPVDRVTRAIERLATSGQVVRSGLGWEAVAADDNGESGQGDRWTSSQETDSGDRSG